MCAVQCCSVCQAWFCSQHGVCDPPTCVSCMPVSFWLDTFGGSDNEVLFKRLQALRRKQLNASLETTCISALAQKLQTANLGCMSHSHLPADSHGMCWNATAMLLLQESQMWREELCRGSITGKCVHDFKHFAVGCRMQRNAHVHALQQYNAVAWPAFSL